MRSIGFISVGLIAFSAQAAAPLTQRDINQTTARYQIAFDYPDLAGQPPFNSAIRQIVDPLVKYFRHEMAQPPPQGAPDAKGYLKGSYKAAALKSGVVSVLLTWQQFMPGMAHPSDGMASINYDSRTQRILKLPNLFRPGSNYLPRLSQLAIASLTRTHPGNSALIQQGAGPSESNFKIFTLTDSTLALHFPTYQVGTRVDGPQQVAIPLDELRPLLAHPR